MSHVYLRLFTISLDQCVANCEQLVSDRRNGESLEDRKRRLASIRKANGLLREHSSHLSKIIEPVFGEDSGRFIVELLADANDLLREAGYLADEEFERFDSLGMQDIEQLIGELSSRLKKRHRLLKNIPESMVEVGSIVNKASKDSGMPLPSKEATVTSELVDVDVSANKVVVAGSEYETEPHLAQMLDALVDAARDGKWWVTSEELQTLPGCNGKNVSREFKSLKAAVPVLAEHILSEPGKGYRLARI